MLRMQFVRAAALVLLAAIARGQVESQPASKIERVSYTVEYQKDILDRAFVTATLFGKADGPVDVQIPTWSPGAYEIKPFYKRILAMKARDAKGAALEVGRVNDLTWKIPACGDWPVTLTYERLDQTQSLSDSGDPTPRKGDYVAFLPTDTFVYVVGAKNVPHDVRFKVPEDWLVMMSLKKGNGPLHFVAPDYDTIVDAPAELGHLTVHRFKVGDAVYSIVLDFRDKNFPLQSLEDLLRRIIRYEVGMWGHAPYAEYQFHVHNGPGFGLEHLTSTTIAVPRFMLKSGIGIFDSLYAHEYFHLWNVKRLRPKQLGPFDYTQPVRTKALWLSEGVTDYYADITCWRSGLWNDGKFLETMQGEIQRLQNTPRRLVESVEVASWNAFDRGYAGIQTEANVDYYNKGKLIGLCVDLTIRDKTKGERSLDDVMRGLYEKYALPKAGFDDDALAADFSTLAGFDLKPFFASYVSGVAELPFPEVLMTIGIRCTPGEPDRKAAMRWWQRSELAIDKGELVVHKPYRSLKGMGLEDGDRVVAVNDAALPRANDPKDLIEALVPKGAGAAELRVKRGENVVSVLVTIPPGRRWDLEQLSNPTATQRKRFEEFKADRYSASVPNGPTLETIGVPPRGR